MKRETFTGIGYNFDAQDLCVIEGAGPIQDRTREHLVSSDMSIVVARKVRIKAIRDLQEGREPKNVVRDPQVQSVSDFVDASGRAWFQALEGLRQRNGSQGARLNARRRNFGSTLNTIGRIG